VLLKSFLVTAAAVGTGLLGAAGATAEPAPAPVLPNVSGFLPLNPSDYTVNGGKWLAFAGPAGVVCTIDVLAGNYGCSGPLPGAPDGVNQVSGGPSGAPVFGTANAPYAAAGAVRPLPPNTRLSYRYIFCGADNTGVVACLNSKDQVGFAVGPNGTFIQLPPPPPPAPPAVPNP
jgi:hypothetical protein